MKAITLAFDADGKAELFHGPDVAPSAQRKSIQDARGSRGLPQNVARLELWERNCTKFAVNKAPAPKESPNEKPKGNVRSRPQRGG